MKQHTQLTLVLVVSALAIGLWCSPVYSQGDSGGWDYKLTPYIWFVWLDGELTTTSTTRTADADFGDVLDDLHFGLMVNFEAWKRDSHWGLGADLLYTDFESDSDADITPSVETALLDLMVAYRFGGNPPASDSALTFDLGGGLRIWHVNAGIEIENNLTLGADIEWWEPFIGARLMWQPSDRWLIELKADVGIFDIGTDINGSEADVTTWNLYAGVNFFITENTSVNAGFRYFDINVDAEDSPTELDVEMYGPTLELAFRF
jgi:opacity protein-like surface antigen